MTFNQIDRTVLATLKPARRAYWVTVALLLMGIGVGAACWIYQIFVGIGVAGQNIPVAWGTYLINFVFWVGIAHSGTLISAILHLFRAGWRNPIARAAETMTVFAVCTAGLYPFIHLGRVWLVYYMLPIPNQRTLWPNFQSPLMFDVVAISTYLGFGNIPEGLIVFLLKVCLEFSLCSYPWGFPMIGNRQIIKFMIQYSGLDCVGPLEID